MQLLFLARKLHKNASSNQKVVPANLQLHQKLDLRLNDIVELQDVRVLLRLLQLVSKLLLLLLLATLIIIRYLHVLVDLPERGDDARVLIPGRLSGPLFDQRGDLGGADAGLGQSFEGE